LKTTLADLKAKRDALQKRLAKARPASAAPVSESELRAWATERFGQLRKLVDGQASTVEARAAVHAYVDRIEIDPDAKRGVLYMPKDAGDFFMREFSTRGAHGDPKGGCKAKGEA